MLMCEYFNEFHLSAMLRKTAINKGNMVSIKRISILIEIALLMRTAKEY